jgi:3-mercaptopyruvate sulfurtransferase SseA
VKILDGGLAKWFAFYHPVGPGSTSKPEPSVLPELKCDTTDLVDYEFVKKNIGNNDV